MNDCPMNPCKKDCTICDNEERELEAVKDLLLFVFYSGALDDITLPAKAKEYVEERLHAIGEVDFDFLGRISASYKEGQKRRKELKDEL